MDEPGGPGESPEPPWPPIPSSCGDIINSPIAPVGGVIRFSFCLRLQNHTLTTSFSSWSDSANEAISCADGLGCLWKCDSSAPLTETSIDVRFLRFRPWAAILSIEVGDPVVESASSSHLASRGFNLHIFLNDNWSASKRQMVVCEKTFPYRVPRAKPTSAWVKPNFIRRCLNCLANCSRSSEEGASSSPEPGSPLPAWWWWLLPWPLLLRLWCRWWLWWCDDVWSRWIPLLLLPPLADPPPTEPTDPDLTFDPPEPSVK